MSQNSRLQPTSGSLAALAAEAIGDCGFWIFDMDGTLTHAIHDFDAIRDTLGLPAGKPILESIEALPADEGARVHQALDALELEIAHKATQQPGAVALLDALKARGTPVGILTRNGKAIADATLKACQLDHYFTPETIVSRECCAPKPDPAGVLKLLHHWSAAPEDTVMIGDYLFDMESGDRAGTHTVHLDPNPVTQWPAVTSLHVHHLDELTALL